MWYLPNKNLEFGLDIPSVCTNQPCPSSAFCTEHKEVCEKLGVSSSLRGFLKHCGVEGGFDFSLLWYLVSLSIGDEYSNDKAKLVESSLKNLHIKAKQKRQTKDADIESNNTPVYEQGQHYITKEYLRIWINITGTKMTLRPRDGLLNPRKMDATQEYVPPCNKDTTGSLM